MAQHAVSIRGLSKQYRLGTHRHDTFYDLLTERLSPWRRATRAEREESTFWALSDIDMDVAPGEVVGIVGRNGAGKSTLLKVLSRITSPTAGHITVRGRLASLLEVGTGFHPELSGRENIFLNGAILGMRRSEVTRRFDDIVQFAEIERFIDTPVKRYSSGMYVRLAFAVAAHLDADVLVVDEVLAVGDAEFQKRCLGKMQEVAHGGRTVLFVSHNTSALTRLCTRGVLLERGRLVADGPMPDVAARYLGSSDAGTAQRVWAHADASGDAYARLRAARALAGGRLAHHVDIREKVELEIDYEVLDASSHLFVGVTLFDQADTALFFSANWDAPIAGAHGAGVYRTRCTIPGNLLAEGLVRVAIEVSSRSPAYVVHALERDAIAFTVVDKGEPGSVRGDWPHALPGAVRPRLAWSIEPVCSEELA